MDASGQRVGAPFFMDAEAGGGASRARWLGLAAHAAALRARDRRRRPARTGRLESADLGTTTVAEWTRTIAGHLVGHVDQALDILRDREALPEGA